MLKFSLVLLALVMLSSTLCRRAYGFVGRVRIPASNSRYRGFVADTYAQKFYSPSSTASRLGSFQLFSTTGTEEKQDTKSKVSSSSSAEETPIAFKDKVKAMWSSYGYVAIGSYLGLYIFTLSSLYTALHMDVFNAASVGLDPATAINKLCNIFESVTGSKSLPGYIKEHPKMGSIDVGTFAIAWVMTKFTEPVRLLVTVTCVPKIAQIFGYDENKNAVVKR